MLANAVIYKENCYVLNDSPCVPPLSVPLFVQKDGLLEVKTASDLVWCCPTILDACLQDRNMANTAVIASKSILLYTV